MDFAICQPNYELWAAGEPQNSGDGVFEMISVKAVVVLHVCHDNKAVVISTCKVPGIVCERQTIDGVVVVL
jgi:hypothetical protein